MRKSTLSLSVVLVASVAASAWLWNALQTERSRNAELVSQLDRERSVKALDEVPPFPLAPKLAQVEVPKSDSAQRTAAGTHDPSREQSAQEQRERQRQLMRDPRIRDAQRAQVRAGMTARRAALIRLLGFTPEQADAAIELEITEQLRWNDEVTTSGDSVQAFKEARARYEVFRREQQDKLRAVVGETKAARYRDYVDSWGSRRQVESLRSELGEANALRDDQVEPLIAAMHAESKQMQSEMQEYRDTLDWEGDATRSAQRLSDRMSEQMKSTNERTIAAASSILTGAQLAALKDQLQQSLDQFEASKQLGMLQSSLDEAHERGSPSN